MPRGLAHLAASLHRARRLGWARQAGPQPCAVWVCVRKGGGSPAMTQTSGLVQPCASNLSASLRGRGESERRMGIGGSWHSTA